tara:strand:- start:21718 stop:21912 length:195 start_codon:yes stop_codon:yes gene_type:complete
MKENVTNSKNIKISYSSGRVLAQALNEVCHGVNIPEAEFELRLGVSKSEAVQILDELISQLEQK